MTTIAILPKEPGSPGTAYQAVAGAAQAEGATAGQALDALTAQLNPADAGTLLVIQHQEPDRFFTADQRRRLEELMTRWRSARDSGTSFSQAERDELDQLVAAEIQATAARAAALIRAQTPSSACK